MKVYGGASDIARMRSLQDRAFAARAAMDRAALEFTTNQKASRYDATGGNLTRLFALERSLDRNAVFSETISLATLRLDMMQEGLGGVLAPAEALALNLSSSTGLGDAAAAMMHANTARRDFAGVVGVLNTQVAGQSLYAGTATDSAAVAQADAILADLDALAGAAATPADALTAIDAYFAKPGGAFYTTGYIGSPDDLAAVEIGEGQRLDASLRADADEFVAVLRAQAVAAVVAGGAFAGDQASQMAMLSEAGTRLLAAKEGMLDLRAHVGSAQEAVERARAGRVAERETLDLARAALIGVDPLDAASTYQAMQAQLESIYTVTSRLANMRFLNYMR